MMIFTHFLVDIIAKTENGPEDNESSKENSPVTNKFEMEEFQEMYEKLGLNEANQTITKIEKTVIMNESEENKFWNSNFDAKIDAIERVQLKEKTESVENVKLSEETNIVKSNSKSIF